MNDQEWESGEGEAEEMGATVQPQEPSYYTYKFACSECTTEGAEWNTEGEAESEGRSHTAAYHPSFTIKSVPHY